jgi:hypothetical protein
LSINYFQTDFLGVLTIKLRIKKKSANRSVFQAIYFQKNYELNFRNNKPNLDCWEMTPDGYLLGSPLSPDSTNHKNTLKEAINLCLMTPACGGVTSLNGRFEVRNSSFPLYARNNVDSWTKPSSGTNEICIEGKSNLINSSGLQAD